MVRNALEPACTQVAAADGQGDVLRWQKIPFAPAAPPPQQPSPPPPDIPDWLDRSAPEEATPRSAPRG